MKKKQIVPIVIVILSFIFLMLFINLILNNFRQSIINKRFVIPEKSKAKIIKEELPEEKSKEEVIPVKYIDRIATTTIETNDWNTFLNNAFEVFFKYPKEWHYDVETYQTPPVVVKFYDESNKFQMSLDFGAGRETIGDVLEVNYIQTNDRNTDLLLQTKSVGNDDYEKSFQLRWIENLKAEDWKKRGILPGYNTSQNEGYIFFGFDEVSRDERSVILQGILNSFRLLSKNKTEKKETSIQDWKVYKNNKYGYMLKYPDFYYKNEIRQFGKEYLDFDLTYKRSGDISFGVYQKEEIENNDRFKAIYDGNIVYDNEIKINNGKIVYSWGVDDENNYFKREMFIIGNEMLIQVSYNLCQYGSNGPISCEEEDRGVLMAMLNTFEFDNSLILKDGNEDKFEYKNEKYQFAFKDFNFRFEGGRNEKSCHYGFFCTLNRISPQDGCYPFFITSKEDIDLEKLKDIDVDEYIFDKSVLELKERNIVKIKTRTTEVPQSTFIYILKGDYVYVFESSCFKDNEYNEFMSNFVLF